jgi:GntR family transcriptional regulator, transcriptional repressor for pyruvate dehydrogenase complex
MSVSEMFKPLAGGRMSAEIVGQIIPLIRSGELQPGDRFPSERELSQTFEVSRVTVRDALRVLEVMGLVQIRVGSAGGAFVTVPSPDVVGESVVNMMSLRGIEHAQLAETRAMLELAVLDLVLVRITDEEIEELRELGRHAQKLTDAGDYDTHLSTEFHAALARCTHNDAVALIADSFAGPLSMAEIRATEPWDERGRRTVEEHIALVEAIAARDGSLARRILRHHLLRNLDEKIGVEPTGPNDSGRLADLA